MAAGSTFGDAQSHSRPSQAASMKAAALRREQLLPFARGTRSRARAEVAPRETGGSGTGAQVLQNGTWSAQAPFTVDALRVTSVSPVSAGPGSAVTITGTGFGTVQGSGIVWLGSTTGVVQSWSDTQVVAVVASNSVTGVVRVQQNSLWSNALTFTMPGNTTVLVPNLVSMAIGIL